MSVFRMQRLHMGRFLRECAIQGKTLHEVKEMCESVNVERLSLRDRDRLAKFIGRDNFKGFLY